MLLTVLLLIITRLRERERERERERGGGGGGGGRRRRGRGGTCLMFLKGIFVKDGKKGVGITATRVVLVRIIATCVNNRIIE